MKSMLIFLNNFKSSGIYDLLCNITSIDQLLASIINGLI